MIPIPVAALTALVEAAAAVASQPDLSAVLETTVTMAKRTTGARYAALGVIGAHKTLVDFVHTGIDPEQADAIGSLPVGKGVLGTLIRDPQPIRLEHISTHPDFVGFPENHPEMDPFLGVPIRAGDQVFGNLYLTDKPGGFSETDESVAQALAAVAGGAISAAHLNQRLRRVALIEDRERIARDLHDAVIQDLFAVGLNLQGLAATSSDPRVANRLDEAVDRIDQSIGSLRSFIFDLRSLDAAQTDPAKAFRRMVERIASPRGINVHTDVGDLGSIVPERLDDALLIAREAVFNAVRHAHARNLTLEIERTEQILRIRVSDDGVGFDPQTAKHGMGIDNMRKRAARSGGTLEIGRSSSGGTTVTAELRL